MNSTLLISALILYILSLATSLVLAIASRKIDPANIRYGIALHLVFVLLSVFAFIAGSTTLRPWFILSAVVTALAIAGWALRSRSLSVILRGYFGLYYLTVILFLVSPSLLVFTITGLRNERKDERVLHLRDNYYLVEQSRVANPQDTLRWKLIQKKGIYKKTLQRDITFRYIPDSVHILQLDNDTILLQSYSHNSGTTDSAVTGLSPRLISSEIIQKKN